MTTETDPIDRMLNAAAPRGVASSARLRPDLARMSSDARAAARPARRRRVRLAAGFGLAAVLLGGAGTAVAVGAFAWEPWADQADIAYPFTLPSGRACEARVQVLEVKDIDENGRIESAPDGELTEHFRSIDAIGRIDMDEAIALVRSLTDANVVVHPDGTMSDAPAESAPMTEDDVHAFAVNRALGVVLHEEFDAMGWGADRWSTNMDILCTPLAS